MDNLEIIIGIENHIELKTKTKIFSMGLVSHNSPPNTMVNNMDIAFPGMMPIVNKKCIKLALIICNILHCKINSLIQFDRKHYYYPDLAKGYQITQQYFPIGINGYLWIKDENNNNLKIKIKQIHLEEDTAKQLYDNENLLLDYNRSGIGLIEIVTKPMLRSIFQVTKYLESLKEILIYSQVSEAKMNEGSLRCDINISLRSNKSKKYGNKVEIKNLNSIKNIETAIKYEIKRQTNIIVKNKVVPQETRKFDEQLQKTVAIRNKNNEIDYYFFPEPNIFPIKLKKQWINSIFKNKPELPNIKRKRYLTQYKLKKNEIDILLQNYSLMIFFEKVLKYNNNYELIINYLLSEVIGFLNRHHILITDTKLTPINFSKMIDLIKNQIISSKQAKLILNHLFIQNISPKKIIKKMNFQQITNVKKIKNIVIPIIQNHTNLLKFFQKKPEKVINYFMGELMKITNNCVSPRISKNIILKLIKLKIK